MPKVNKIQASFDSGEISKSVYGRVDIQDRYDHAMAYLQNYLPILQGPLLRRPGTKYVTNSKDASKIATLIPFQFSANQNYMMEFGDRYVRFFTNEAPIVTSQTQYQLNGTFNLFNVSNINSIYTFWATRISPVPIPGEISVNSTVVTASSILELVSPYAWPDVQNIKYTQKQDVLYLTHPNYPPYKLERHGGTEWTFKPIQFKDGPYLPLNSYQSIGDSVQVTFQNITPNALTNPVIVTGPSFQCSSMIAGSNGAIRVITQTTHNFTSGNKVVVEGAGGTIEANNIGTNGCPAAFGSSTIVACSFWTVNVISPTSFDLLNSTFSHSFTGSGCFVYPSLFQMDSTGSWSDWNKSVNSNRPIGLIQNGVRSWGHFVAITASHKAILQMDPGVNLNDSSLIVAWQLGTYSILNGYPSAVCFHQDRLGFGGPVNSPQELDLSMVGNYEQFSASGSNLQVSDNNACQFNLNSQDLNAIRWMKSNSQGLLAGTASSEWTVTPSTQAQALSPTNVNAQQVSFYGSYDSDAIQAGLAIVHIQRAQRKVRELLYYWQVASFRSANLSELSEHITIPAVIKLTSQKEPHPTIWGLRSDGNLISIGYSRDDINLKAGWARHFLGGQSDTAGTPPIVKSMNVIPSGDGSYDEVWMTVQRFINGTSVGTVEYMTKPYDDNMSQPYSYHFDCGATYDAPITVTNIINAPSCVITAPVHGLTNSATVRFYNTVGINITSTDANGNITTSSQLNSQTFLVASSSTNAFKITDFLGNDINTASSSIYVGSSQVKKLITSISGLTWLANEQVSILADGGIHVNTSISSGGVLNLSYPAAVVSVGYGYNSDAEMLRTKDGSAQGTSIGSARRVNRVAFMLHDVGDLQFGPSFFNMTPVEFSRADANAADNYTPLFDGIHREGIESGDSEFTDTVCFRQNTGLPGMIQAVVRFLEENDV